jgi:chromosome segregation ATPase
MQNQFLHLALAQLLEDLRAGDDTVWIRAERLLRLAREDDPEIDDSDAGVAVILQDADELARLVEGWSSGSITIPDSDRAILKRAMKAVRKRLKLVRLDDESSLGGSAMTGGRHSAISAVRPPEQYPQEVWDYLARIGRIRDIGHGLIEPMTDQD